MTRAHENVLHFFGCFNFQQKLTKRVFLFFLSTLMFVLLYDFSFNNPFFTICRLYVSYVHLHFPMNSISRKANKFSTLSSCEERLKPNITNETSIWVFLKCWISCEVLFDEYWQLFVWPIGRECTAALHKNSTEAIKFIYLFNRLKHEIKVNWRLSNSTNTLPIDDEAIERFFEKSSKK